jgi:hypothetical protein
MRSATRGATDVHVKVLEHVEYPPDGRSWQSTKVPDPSLADIVVAVRRLDRDRFPFLFLWPSADEGEHDLSGDHDAFEVMGGNGVYWLAGTFDGHFQRRLDYPERGEQAVEVWTSDQGFSDTERHVHRDVEAAIRAACYYAEHGEFDPSLRWEEPE